MSARPPALATVTAERVHLAFVFTDIEGSTRLLERLEGGYGEVLATHAEIVRRGIAEHHGREVDTQGDAFFVVFPRTPDAVRFAAGLQAALAAHPWPEGVTVRLRIGIHAGQATPTRMGFVGMDVHHGARVAAAAHGGQVLVTREVADELSQDDPAQGPLPALRSLGDFVLKDIKGTVELLQLVIQGLPGDFPPPRTLDEVDEPPTDGEPPYPGLVPFEETDAERFFGREVLVASLVERLERSPFLAVIGASGSGKSSVVRAGLIPALRRAAGPRTITLLTPTEHPLAALAGILPPTASPPWTLVIDQAEELFTLCRDDAERAAFIDRMLGLLDVGSRVVVVLRADFYDRLAAFERLRTLAAEHQVYLGPMGPAELRAAIEGPAKLGGWRLAPGLGDLMIHDVGTEPGALPLLSHALRETWDRRRGTLLTLRGYLDSGGVQGAIARTADQVIATLDGPEVERTRAIFLRLTELGAETPDTRRRARLDELVPAGRGDTAGRAILDRLVAARLVVADDQTAEVAHEALIREWPLLREWLDEDRGSLRLHRAVTEAAAEWVRSGEDPSLLFRGSRLAAATDWLLGHPDDANLPERRFLDASVTAAEAEATEREAARQRELDAATRAAQAERARADVQARSARRIRRAAVGLVALLLVAALAAGYAFLAQQEAERAGALALERQMIAEQQQRLSLSRQLAAEGLASDDDLPHGTLLALAAGDVADTPEARSSLMSLLSTNPRLVRSLSIGEDIHELVLADDGRTLVGALRVSPRIVRWDLEDGSALVSRELFEPGPIQVDGGALALSPDGTRAVRTDRAGMGDLELFDLATGESIRDLPGTRDAVRVHFVPGGRFLAMTTETGGRLHEASTGQELARISLPQVTSESFTYEMAVDPSGAWLALSSWDGLVMLWDRETLTPRQIVDPGPVYDESTVVREMAFSPDGTELALGSDDGTISRVETGSGEPIGDPVDASDSAIDHLVYGADGTRLAWSSGREAHVMDVATGEDITGALTLRDDDINALAFDGRTLALADADGRVGVWDLERIHPLATALGRVPDSIDPTADHPFLQAFALSHDGRRLASGTTSGEITIWDVATGRSVVGPIPAHPTTSTEPSMRTRGVHALAFSPDGSMLASSGSDGTVRRWDTTDGHPIGEPSTGHDLSTSIGEIGLLRFSPDGRILASAASDERIILWDSRTGTMMGSPIQRATAEVISADLGVIFLDQAFRDLEFTPDGRTIAAAGIASAYLWDVATQEPLGEPIGPHDAHMRTIAIDPSGTTLLVLDENGGITLWNLSDRRSLGTIRASGPLREGTFDPTGSTMVTQGENGLEIWDMTTRRRIGRPIAETEPSFDLWFTDPHHFVTHQPSGLVTGWTIDPTMQRAAACMRSGRDLTREEWAASLGDKPFLSTCPDPAVTEP